MAKKVAKRVVKKKVRKKPIPKGIAPLDVKVVRKKGAKHSDRIRTAAMAVYVMDMDGATVEDLHKDPRFKGIQLDTLRRWSTEDKWMALRKEALEKVREKLAKELTFRLSENIMREVNDLIELREIAWGHLRTAEPKSWEGVAKAFLDMNKRLGEIAELVKQGALDDMGRKTPESSATMQADYKIEDLRAAAKMLTGKRRAALRARAAREKKKEVTK